MRHVTHGFVLAACLGFFATARAADSEAPEGFHKLFNGKDLTGWKVNQGGDIKVWGADDGILYVHSSGGGGWLMTEKVYADFEVRLEYRLPKHGNSGVGLRCPMRGDPAYVGMEIQILDETNYKGLRPAQYTGSIYDVVPPSKHVTRPHGEWNQMHITAKGRHIIVEVNGTKVVDADLDDHKDRADKHPGLLRTKGHVGLQSHGGGEEGRVEFRSIYLKPL
jgi:hypothetical protein